MSRSNPPLQDLLSTLRLWARDVRSYLERQRCDSFEVAEAVMVDTRITPGRVAAADERLRERLGSQLETVLGGELVSLPQRADPPRWSVHCCALDAECRELDAPARLHLTTPWWNLDLGLLPGTGTAPGPAGHRLGPITLTPAQHSVCHNVVALECAGEMLRSLRTCPLRRGHGGGCLEWLSGERVTAPRLMQV